MLVTLLDLVKARGYAIAKLNTSSENIPMQRAAIREGFEIISRTLRFARVCRPTTLDHN